MESETNMEKIKTYLYKDIGIILCILFYICFMAIAYAVKPYLDGADWYFFSSLQRLHDDMKPMTINERIAKYGLKTDRADVIIPAAEIFMTVAQAIGCSEIHVPNISLADGIIDGLYKKSKG